MNNLITGLVLRTLAYIGDAVIKEEYEKWEKKNAKKLSNIPNEKNSVGGNSRNG